jgi:DNA-binding transcriptional ArsR family regulator
VLASAPRLGIALTLARHGEACVSALCALMGQPPPALSRHLRRMRLAGLLDCRRQGKEVHYRVAAGPLGDLLGRLFAEAGDPPGQMHFVDFSLVYEPGRVDQGAGGAAPDEGRRLLP